MKQFRTALMSTFVLMASLTGHHATSQSLSATPEKGSKVEYIGSMNDLIVFELRLQNAGSRPATLSILDENENEIWSESIDGSVTKRYKFENRYNKIRFNVTGFGHTLNETFNVSYRTEEKLQVLKAR